MNAFDKELFEDLLVFQGSNDGANYDDLYTADAFIHEGFNTINLDVDADNNSVDKPAYRYYRFKNSVAGGCKIGEVILNGWIVHSDNAATYAVNPQFEIDGTSQAMTATVTYSSSLTPTVTGVSPIQVSVLGGDEVTFTGTGFSNSINDIEIKIDGVACSVSAATTTSISCTAGTRPGIVAPSIVFRIDGKGQAAMQGNNVLYS